MTPLEIAGLTLELDASGRTEAYYCRNAGSTVIDARAIAALKARLAETGAGVIRICLHEGPQAPLHEMVIVQKRGSDYPPHKHLAKDESYHMLEGRLRVDFHDDTGEVAASAVIGGPGTGLPALLRVRAGIWHSTHPETDVIAVHESRPGPFMGNDSVDADW